MSRWPEAYCKMQSYTLSEWLHKERQHDSHVRRWHWHMAMAAAKEWNKGFWQNDGRTVTVHIDKGEVQ